MGLRADRFLLPPPRTVDMGQAFTDSQVAGTAGNGPEDRILPVSNATCVVPG